MMEAFGESRRPQIRQAVQRIFESTGIRFPVIGADRVAVAERLRFGEGPSLTPALHPYRHRNRCACP
ncbi:hypothetical protein MKK67_15625 [Methylobacterium sp. J-072]|uniref:hypothetical protein n=1 Tax=Methylobacterium sp. J-072 TaxID=2836651 RepID=UPI001FB8CA1D|nr:hypothetical protein [Methylobacterium sp. J-072]MCJ2093910.1 hypothetical protein [Methylobacterium sp. J-072]